MKPLSCAKLRCFGSCWFLILSVTGCTSPTLKGQLTDWGLEPYVQVTDSKAYREALLAAAFVTYRTHAYENQVKSSYDRSSRFTLGEEAAAQQAMTELEEGKTSVWNNARLGEVQFAPGAPYVQHNRKCRNYTISFIVTGRYVTRERNTGSACLNPQSQRWEWL